MVRIKKKGGKMVKKKKRSPPANIAWRNHLKSVYRDMKKKDPNANLGDAMKKAKKTYKRK